MENKSSRKKAIESKCHDCMAQYVDGKQDCEVVVCPLYPFMPYRRKTPNLDWQQYSPRRIGLVTWEEVKKQEVHKNGSNRTLNELGGNTLAFQPKQTRTHEKQGHTQQKRDTV